MIIFNGFHGHKKTLLSAPDMLSSPEHAQFLSDDQNKGE